MLHFEGDREFALPPEAAFAKLRDAAFLVTCIPDATVTGTPERDRATCTVRPGVAFVRGTLDLTVTIVEAKDATASEPAALRFLLQSKGIGTTSDVDVSLTLTAADSGTRCHWNAAVTQLGGLLKAVPSGLIRGAAQKTIEDVWAGIGEKLR